MLNKAKNKSKKEEIKTSIFKSITTKSSKRLKYLIISVLGVLVLLLGVIGFSSRLSNPLLGVKGLVLMSKGTRKIHKLSDEPLVYICDSFSDFIVQMISEDYIVEDKRERYFELRRDGEVITLKSEDFLNVYEIIREVDRR